MSAKPATVTAHQCPDCATIYEPDDLVPIYECSRCGQTSTERRCEDDNIFMGRAGSGCEGCAVECDEIEAVEDHDGQLIPADEWEPEGSKADRDAAASARRDRERAEKARQEKEAREAASETVAVTALAVGDWIMNPEPHPNLPEKPVQVKAMLELGRDTVGLVVAEYGIAQVFPAARQREFTRVPPEETFRRREQPFGLVTFEPDGGAMVMSSAPREEEYIIEMSHLTRGEAPWGGVPCVTVARHTPGLRNMFGVFVSRGQAEEALAVWEQAARALAEGLDQEPTAARDRVQVEKSEYSTRTDSLGRPVEFTLGTSDWSGDTQRPYLNVLSGGSNATVADAGPLLAAVEVAREHLGHLDH